MPKKNDEQFIGAGTAAAANVEWDIAQDTDEENPTPTADEPKDPRDWLLGFRYYQREANRLTILNRALQDQLNKSLGFVDTRTEEESEAAAQIKAEVVQAMRDMLPQAKRAAKRGKPALLRLIVRTIKTKL